MAGPITKALIGSSSRRRWETLPQAEREALTSLARGCRQFLDDGGTLDDIRRHFKLPIPKPEAE